MACRDRTREVRRLEPVSLPRTPRRRAMAAFHAVAQSAARLGPDALGEALRYAAAECRRAGVSADALAHCAVVAERCVPRRAPPAPPSPTLEGLHRQYAYVSPDYGAVHDQQRAIAKRRIARDLEGVAALIGTVGRLVQRNGESLSRLEAGLLRADGNVEASRDALAERLGAVRAGVGLRASLAGAAIVAALFVLLVL